jgi:hypothetical protein
VWYGFNGEEEVNSKMCNCKAERAGGRKVLQEERMDGLTVIDLAVRLQGVQ